MGSSHRKFRSQISDNCRDEKQSRKIESEEKTTGARKSEERRYRRKKCSESRESLCFSIDLWVGRVEK